MKNCIKVLVILIFTLLTMCKKEEIPEISKLIKSIAVNNRVVHFTYDSNNRLIKRSDVTTPSFGVDSLAYKDNKVECYYIISSTNITKKGHFNINSESLATSYEEADGTISAEFEYNDNKFLSNILRFYRNGEVIDTIQLLHINDSLIKVNDDSVVLNQHIADFKQNLIYPYDIKYKHESGPVRYSPLSYIGLPFLGDQSRYLISYSYYTVNVLRYKTIYDYEFNNDGTVSKFVTYVEEYPESAVSYSIEYY